MVEGGVTWLSRDDDRLPPRFCAQCSHKQIMFQPEEEWDDEEEDTSAACNMSCSWPPTERPPPKAWRRQPKASRRNMYLCYMCDCVYLASRVCPRCKAELRVRDGSIHRRDDYCDACRGAEDGGRSVQEVVREARSVSNRPCTVCQIPEYAHAEALAPFNVKHPFTPGVIRF